MERGVIVGGLLISGSLLLAVMLIGSIREETPPRAPTGVECTVGDGAPPIATTETAGSQAPGAPISDAAEPDVACSQ